MIKDFRSYQERFIVGDKRFEEIVVHTAILVWIMIIFRLNTTSFPRALHSQGMKYKCILWVCLNHRRCVYSFQSCMPGSANVASKSTPALIIANMIKQTMRRKTMQVIIMQAVVGEPSKEQQKHLKTILFLGTPFS